MQRPVCEVRLQLNDVTANRRSRHRISSCSVVGLPRIRRMPSICAGDSGGAGQHLPQCMVDEPETLWRYDPHGLCAAAYRSSLASYRARSLGFRLMVPQNSQGSASWYTRARRRGLVRLVRQRCDKRTASRSRSRSRWARSCLAATANGEPRSPRRSYSAVSGTRPTVPGQLHRLAAEQVLSRSARHGEACGQCASPSDTVLPHGDQAGAIVGPRGSVRCVGASVQSAQPQMITFDSDRNLATTSSTVLSSTSLSGRC